MRTPRCEVEFPHETRVVVELGQNPAVECSLLFAVRNLNREVSSSAEMCSIVVRMCVSNRSENNPFTETFTEKAQCTAIALSADRSIHPMKCLHFGFTKKNKINNKTLRVQPKHEGRGRN